MPRNCMFGCKPLPGVPFHVIPNPEKEQERFNAWVRPFRDPLETISDQDIYQTKRVCDKHFIEKHKNRNGRLNALAVPILHLPSSSMSNQHLEQQTVEQSDLPPHTTELHSSTAIPSTSSAMKAAGNETVELQTMESSYLPPHAVFSATIPSTSTCMKADIPEATTLCRGPPPGMCRLCATVTEFVVPIFEGEGLTNSLADKIQQHLPIQVSQNDVLPVVMCFQCTSTLLAWHELVLCSVQADSAMRERFNLNFSAPLQRQQQTNIEASQSQDKDEKSQPLDKLIKNVLANYLHNLNMDEDSSYVELVCQKCISKPGLTIEDFTKHLNSKHRSEVSNEDTLLNFIKSHITFEEALLSDFERDADSEATEQSEMSERKSPPTLLCPYCDSAFSSTARLIHHLNKHVELSIEDGVECCALVYRTRNAFVAHLQKKHVDRLLSDPENTCKSCGLPAASEAELRAHVEEHHAEKRNRKMKKESGKNQKSIPAVCPECNKTFSNKYNMFFHMSQAHTATGPHRCERCGRSYSTRGNLAQHARVAHEGRLPHACAACGEAFATRDARDVHARLHSGLRPFRCERCGKCFRAKNSLDRHTDAHLDVRRHECDVCAKAFRKRSHLAAHARTHRQRQ